MGFNDILDELKYSKISRVNNSTDVACRRPRIETEFSKELLAKLYLLASDFTIDDNNERADYIEKLLSPLGFVELGTGTNRIAFRKDGYVFKIALDRRGFVDNISEYYRSIEMPDVLAKVYETNRTIIVCEYVNLLSEEEFLTNKDEIKQVLDRLSARYVMGDLGLTQKNYCNWGYRANGDIVALDFAYLYPIKGNESVMVCGCGGDIVPNSTYTGYKCNNPKCGIEYTASELHNYMTNTDTNESVDVIDIVGNDTDKLKVSDDGNVEVIAKDAAEKIKETQRKLLEEAKNTKPVNASTSLAGRIKSLMDAGEELSANNTLEGFDELPSDMIPDNSGISRNEYLSMLEQYNILASSDATPISDDDDDE